MAVAQGNSSSLFGGSAILRRLRNTFRTIFMRGDLSTLIIVCAIMVIPALGLSSALDIQKDPRYWPVSLNQLAVVGLASVIFGFLLARSHYSEIMALLMSAIYGVATIGILQLVVAPGNPLERVVTVITRLRSALTGVNGGFQDPFVLILFLCTLFWFLGHNTAWHIFRIDRVWRAVVPPGIVLLINGLYNFGPGNLDFYLVIYVFLSLMLVIRSHIEAREFDWYMNRVGFERSLRTWFFRSGAVAGVIILLIAWLIPTGSPEQNQKRFQQFINGDVLNRLNQLASRLFAPLEGQGVTTADYYGRDKLQLGGAIQLGDQTVMLVAATPGPRYYWKSRVFDSYNNGEWTSERTLEIAAQKGALELALPPYQLGTRADAAQRFTLLVSSRLIYAAPQVRSVDIPAEADADYVDPQTKTLNPSVVRPMDALQERDSYGVVSSISVASADVLRLAAQQYPAWVLPDLALGANVAPRARALALQLVHDAKAFTAYDKAKVIEAWLRKNIQYDEVMPTPPEGKDPIDWALFDIKRAYCTYYASAMVVMLRSQNVPARMAAGFAQGTWDDASKAYMVRERDAHTWVEVFFPGAGWVEFEPTSAQQNLDRPDSRAAAPTPTLTPTLTPSPTPLPTATPAVQPPQNQALQTVQPPTDTPTTPPTLTATPPPPPAPLPASPGSLSGLLQIMVLIAALIALVSFIGVGLFWWIEYRGLDRLSPVGRAYARMAIYARWLKIPATAATTPLERGRRIAREVPEQSPQIVTITDMYINERYAPPHPANPGDEVRANRAWQITRRGMIGQRIKRLLRRK